jgi:NAD(P)H-hydrate epimerase
MKVVSSAEMREIDDRAQTRHGIDAFNLMTHAGRGIADQVMDAFQPQRACIVCGKGNNAGDGFVVAQRLYECGREVSLVCMEAPQAYQGAARQAWDALSSKIRRHTREDLKAALSDADVVVDALLGTGISGAARGAYADVIRELNGCGKPVVAVDVPSGLRELKSGEEQGEVICAKMTVTVGLPKTMLLKYPGSEFAGRLTILKINFPDELLTSDEWQLNWAVPREMKQWIVPRRPDSNKGTWGHVGIVGSALEYAGATVMVARGALRAGCGLATIYTLPAANAIYKMALPEATSVIIGHETDAVFSEAAAEQFLESCKDHSVLTVGPGLGTSGGAKAFLHRLLQTWKLPLILDADALNILSDGGLGCLRDRTECLITPHPGEMARLTGSSVAELQRERESVTRSFAQEHGVTVLLKGTGTLIARPDGQAWLVPGEEAALAKGGTGDVLTGVIAGLFAQGMPLWQAAVTGATAHLHAGHCQATKSGSRGVLATEIADEVPRVLDDMESCS